MFILLSAISIGFHEPTKIKSRSVVAKIIRKSADVFVTHHIKLDARWKF